MKLKFKEKYLSISQFNTTNIDGFTVLTGVNGSGKSHLLEAIEQNKVTIEGIEAINIVRFNYETFKLENEGAYSGHQISAEVLAAWNYLKKDINPNISSWRSSIGDTEYEKIVNNCKENKKSLWDIDDPSINSYKKNIKKHFSQPNIKNTAYSKGILSLLKTLPYSIDEIEESNFRSFYKPYSFKNDFLPQELGKIVWDYYVKYRENQVNRSENKEYGRDYPVLSEEEFVTHHGEKPWELLNKILSKFDSLDYIVSSPEGLRIFGEFQIKLIHTKKPGLEIDFSSLSSGERVLMALVASVYKASGDKYFPDILLLDELDASLHPSMIKNMLAVIKEIFIDKGIKVILVTHSPTTIAFSPDRSIYVMDKSGQNRILKKSKQEALAILTEGFATLDEGIMLFDSIIQNSCSIITEGKNTLLIEKALELYGIQDVKVVTGFEEASGKDQLRTLFQFFSRANHKKNVFFVWDCDVTFNLNETNNTFPYILEKNDSNSIAEKGIENMFSESLLSNFTTTKTDSWGRIQKTFDGTRKKDLIDLILQRNNKTDFINFEPLIDKICQVNSGIPSSEK